MPLDIDADIRNADWTKRTFDLQVHSADELRAWLAAQGMTVEQFVKLPAYRHARRSGDYPWLKNLITAEG